MELNFSCYTKHITHNTQPSLPAFYRTHVLALNESLSEMRMVSFKTPLPRPNTTVDYSRRQHNHEEPVYEHPCAYCREKVYNRNFFNLYKPQFIYIYIYISRGMSQHGQHLRQDSDGKKHSCPRCTPRVPAIQKQKRGGTVCTHQSDRSRNMTEKVASFVLALHKWRNSLLHNFRSVTLMGSNTTTPASLLVRTRKLMYPRHGVLFSTPLYRPSPVLVGTFRALQVHKKMWRFYFM